ncbi:50S ribosomal protein L10 [Blattabacterium cuenoti]|uniref:50S ribosomal protein L10 n=1 Tax=Blattabacterium cuenoti TaxID=1653831 RepID=UPI00163C6F68|nr:50S ribosomal protein L10 [Blattabacterium cuenoti]
MKKEKSQKQKELLSLFKILSNNKVIYLIDISGLNSNQIFFLRKSFYKNFIHMKLVKNTILKKAMEKVEKNKFRSFFSILRGNTTILFSNENSWNIMSKIIKKFHLKEDMEKPYLKAAYVHDLFYFGNKSLELLMSMKSKEDMIVYILSNLKNPIQNLILSLEESTKNKIFKILNIFSLNSTNKGTGLKNKIK